MDLPREIRARNPWWRAPHRIEDDPHLEEFRQGVFHWDPPVLDALDGAAPGVHTLRGPRQVGKTTTLKRIVARALDRGHTRVGFFSFDLAEEPSEVLGVLRTMKELHPSPDGPWLFLLDEVTQLDDWQLGVKYAWDQGLVRGDTLLLSGSSARDLLENAELLPGRRGGGEDFVQLPMSFRAFVDHVTGSDLDVPVLSPAALASEEHRELVRETALHVEILNRRLADYLACGGLPRAVRDWIREDDVSAETLRMVWQAVAGDLTRGGLKREKGLKLLERVGISLGSNLAWQTAAEDMSVHRDTAKRYVRFLTLGFTLLPIYFWDLSGARFREARQRKVYFRDPLFARIPRAARATRRRLDEAALVEGAVAEAIFRSIPASLVDSFPFPRSVAYWKAKSGREIDFLADPAGETLAIEVKWGDNRTRLSDARRALSATFDDGLVLTESIFQPEREFPAIPTSVFLYLVSDGRRFLHA